MRVGIVGGGVGGLTAAIALARAGFEVRVYERAKRLRSVGGALLLWSNAARTLVALGLGDALLAAGAIIETTEFRSARGELLSTLPIGQLGRRLGAPTLVVPRSALIDLLARALPGGVVRTGHCCTGFTQSADEVCVELEGKKAAAWRCDVLIGADGLHSIVREQLFGAGEPRAAGQEAWVGIARFRHFRARAGVAVASVGNGPRFWAVPLSGGRVYWYATLKESGPSAREVRGKQDLLELFAGWHQPIVPLIEATSERQLTRTRLCDRPPLDRFSQGRVTLLGDAAHPSTPDLGQGACQAIESAATLAEMLKSKKGEVAALRAYENLRLARTRRINELSRLTAMNSTVDHPLLCQVRDLAMKVGLRAVGMAQLEWLLSPTAGAA